MGDTYTHGHHESVLRSHTWRTLENSAAYLIDELQPGRSLLDIGCGPGTITLDFAARLAPGVVTGIATKHVFLTSLIDVNLLAQRRDHAPVHQMAIGVGLSQC